MEQKIFISKEKMDIAQTLECGQIFSYEKIAQGYAINSGQEFAVVKENIGKQIYEIDCTNKKYFINFFDLQTDYMQIKERLARDTALKKPIEFGAGIRILRQDLLEIFISFAISANNHIKRISASIAALRKNFGTRKKINLTGFYENYYAFPTLTQLSEVSEKQFLSLGVGYRAPQLVKLVKQLQMTDFGQLNSLQTEDLKKELLKFSGIGPKVADCILLFGFGRRNVFPVDTWIEKVFNNYYGNSFNRLEIRKKLTEIYGELSGYAQQYLFYFARSTKISNK